MPQHRLLTVTWSADRTHFELLRHSLANSRLSAVPHDVVVHTEDLQDFRHFRSEPIALKSTAEVLPQQAEEQRISARRMQLLAGRAATRVGGSACRLFGRPAWTRYTGWHTQQLCKLASAAASDAETVIVIDSDVVVTPSADTSDFAIRNHPVCFVEWQPSSAISSKVRNWQRSAHRLFGLDTTNGAPVDCYFDTPFTMHPPAVRKMLQWLEQRFQKPWWVVLSEQPPRRWSEFCTYKTWLRNFSEETIDFRGTALFGYLFEAGDVAKLVADFARLVEKEGRRYITIHSQSAGRRLWTAEAYAEGIRSYLGGEPILARTARESNQQSSQDSRPRV